MGCVVPNGDLLFTNYAVTAIGVRRLLYKGPYFCALHLDVMEGGGRGAVCSFPSQKGRSGDILWLGASSSAHFSAPLWGGGDFCSPALRPRWEGEGRGGGGGRGAARPHCTAAPPHCTAAPPGSATRVGGRAMELCRGELWCCANRGPAQA